MLRHLTLWDYRVTKQLFQEVFDESEDNFFADAWLQRNVAVGYWHRGVLLGAALVSSGDKLEYIFVHDDYRGKGIGTQILKFILLMRPNLHLTAVTDPGVRAWYVKHGFYQTSENTYKHRRPRLLRKGQHPLSNAVVAP
jgi:GNAT superfamily N-acetyltransferase